jgi:peroxiredoxin
LLTACGAAPRRPDRLPAAAAFTLLDDDSGARHALPALLAGQRLTALVFWSAHCPCVRRYQARVDALLDRWPARGVAVLGVAANVDETPREQARARRARGVRLPVLRDPGGRLAAALGVRSTPSVVVLRPDGTVAYHGWLDNEREPGQPGREPWLEQALEAALAGAPGLTLRPVWGCRIPRGGARERPEGAPATAAGAEAPCGCRAQPGDAGANDRPGARP